MYNKINLLVNKVAAKRSVRPALSSVAFYGNKTVASDSFKLIEVTNKNEETKLETPIMINAAKVKKFTSDPYLFCQLMAELDDHVVEKYLDYEQVLGEAEKRGGKTIRISAEHIEAVCSILKKVTNFKDIKLTIPEEDGKPLLFIAENDEQIVKAIVMPMTGSK